MLLSGAIPLLWGLSGRVIAHFGYGKEHEVGLKKKKKKKSNLFEKLNYFLF